MGTFDTLMKLQEADTSLDQLRHRHANLPERAELATAAAAARRADEAVESTFAALHQVQSSQKALEDEAATTAEKVHHVDRMLYGGTVTAPKELAAYEIDLTMLKDRQSHLEDQVIELMEQAEPLEAELKRQRGDAEEAASSAAGSSTRLVAVEAALEAEIASAEITRTEIASDLPDHVVKVYEALRKGLGGVGAAHLNGARCDGCHLEIPSAQLEALRRAPEDEMLNCPECGRILVR